MNLVFHTITGATIATAISAKKHWKLSTNKILFLGFTLGVLSHGILDFIPHQYPFSPKIDVLISIILMILIFSFIKKDKLIFFVFCLFGAFLPDLVDLGPALINKFIGTNIPTIKIFPWHWSKYSGSIFDNKHNIKSNIAHIMVLISNLIIFLYFKKKNKFKKST